jgi:K+-sensing histidine kinase KdpD
VEVQDSGTGITGEHPQRIFGAFFPPSRVVWAWGLSICRSIIDPHSGGISAVNDAKPGAIFRLTPPASRDAAA